MKAVMTYDLHSRRVRRARSSSRGRIGSPDATCEGTVTASAAPAISVAAATARKVARQPACWPRIVPAGRPTTVASVSPPTTRLMARPRRSGGTSAMAVVAATDQNPA